MRRRTMGAAAVVVAGIAVGAGVALTSPGGGAAATGTGDDTETTIASDQGSPSPGPFDTATVERGDLTAEEDFSGSVGFGDEWRLPLALDGIITAAPTFGAVVAFGSPLVTVDNHQVFLAEGGMPMYRDLRLESTRQEGYDVVQLQQFLIALGFDDDGAMTVDGEFGTTTRNAVRDWQDARGVDDTGIVTPQDLVFSETPLRVSSDLRVGTTFESLEVTAPDAAITVDASSDDRAWLPEGTAVSIELADGSSVTGTVTEQSAVSADDGSTAYRSTIAIDSEVSTTASNARVVVSSTVAADVLIVPVAALLAPAEGGFAVEIVDGSSTHLVAVELGTILDGRVEITGDIAEGDTVVVAG